MTRRTLLWGLPLLLLDPRQSVARTRWQASAHPLNDPLRCEGWWLTTPLTSPRRWVDLVRQRVGTTTSIVTSGLRYPTTRRGAWGEARFDGVDDAVVLPDLLDNAPTLSVHVAMWATSGVRQALVTKASNYSDGSPGWYLVMQSDGSLGFWIVQDGSNYAGKTSIIPIGDGTWHAVGATLTGWTAADITLWVDGQADTSAATWPAGTVTTMTTSTSVLLGTMGDGTDPYGGRMDDIRLYHDALSEIEMRVLAQAPRQQYRPLLADEVLVARAPTSTGRVPVPGLLPQ